jgi:glycosyltransferase involved in cell wall biosynthesis
MAAAPRICILFEFREGPWGGGNQFLKALWKELGERGRAEEDPELADVLLVNSHHDLARAAALARRAGPKVIVHRVDGPVGLIRGRDDEVDRVLYRFNRAAAAGTIFQSEWSRQANAQRGLRPARQTVIFNAPDPAIFHPDPAQAPPQPPTRLIATSWSPNPRKGFDFYDWLDRNLDFERFEMTFVGQSPIRFRNIRMVEPLASAALADELRAHHIFITGSRTDPCSNSLLEALHCGLPALALHDGGHPELIGTGGETFTRFDEAPAKLERIAAGYAGYRARIDVPSLAGVVDRYLAFMDATHAAAAAAAPRGRLPLWVAGALGRALEHPVSKRALAAVSGVSGGRLP